MAFNVGDRVKVNSDHSQWRGHLGKVMSVVGNNHQVRLDTFPDSKTVLLTTDELKSTTQPDPVTQS
jgi:ribosomal protein L21E